MATAAVRRRRHTTTTTTTNEALHQFRVGDFFLTQDLAPATSASVADGTTGWGRTTYAAAASGQDEEKMFTVWDIQDPLRRVLSVDVGQPNLSGAAFATHAVVVSSSSADNKAGGNVVNLRFRQLSPYKSNSSSSTEEPESYSQLTWMTQLNPDSNQWLALQWLRLGDNQAPQLVVAPWRDTYEQRVQYYTRSMRALFFVPNNTHKQQQQQRYFLALDMTFQPVDERLAAEQAYHLWMAIDCVPSQRHFVSLVNKKRLPAHFIAIEEEGSGGALLQVPLTPENEAMILLFRTNEAHQLLSSTSDFSRMRLGHIDAGGTMEVVAADGEVPSTSTKGGLVGFSFEEISEWEWNREI